MMPSLCLVESRVKWTRWSHSHVFRLGDQDYVEFQEFLTATLGSNSWGSLSKREAWPVPPGDG